MCRGGGGFWQTRLRYTLGDSTIDFLEAPISQATRFFIIFYKKAAASTAMNVDAARAKMKARMKGGSRTGGKGSVRRKKKAVRKTTGTDEKRLQATLKRLNVNNIPAIEEVNLFKDNGTVIHFNAPKVQASIAANTYVISGACETKQLQELLPGIINQLGPDNLQNLKKIAEAYSGGAGGDDDDDDDDEIPDLVENFEDAASN